MACLNKVYRMEKKNAYWVAVIFFVAALCVLLPYSAPQVTFGVASSNDCFRVERSATLSGLETQLVVNKICTQSAAIALPIELDKGFSSLLRLRYLSNGFTSLLLKVIEEKQTAVSRTLGTVALYGTSPGYVSKLIELPAEQIKVLALHLEFPEGRGQVRLKPLQSIHSERMQEAYKNGVLFSLRAHAELGWLAVCILAGLLATAFRYGNQQSNRLRRILTCAVVLFLCISGLYCNLAAHPVTLLALPYLLAAFGCFLTWQWIVLLPFVDIFPPPVEPAGYLRSLLLDMLSRTFPDGYLMRGGDEKNLAPIRDLLASLNLPLVCTIALLGILGAAYLVRRRAAPASALLFALFTLNFIIYPVYQLPIDRSLQQILACLLLLVFVAHFAFLASVEHCSAYAKTVRDFFTASRGEYGVLAVLAAAFIFFHWSAIHLPPTWNSDESDLGYWVISSALSLFGLQPNFTGRVISVLLLAMIFIWGRYALRSGRSPLLVYPLILLCAAIIIFRMPIGWNSFQLYRYAPFSKIGYGLLAILSDGSLIFSRLQSVVLVSICAGIVYLAGKHAGFDRAAAVGGTCVYLSSFLIFYWSSFSYVLSLTLIQSALALGFFLVWLTKRDRASLYIAGSMLALGFLTRETALAAIMVYSATALVFYLASARNEVSPRDLIWFFAALGLPIIIWQKVLVGSWYSWVGRDFAVDRFVQIISEGDHWKAMPWNFFVSSGPFVFGYALSGFLVLLCSTRTRWLGVFLLVNFLAEYAFPMIFSRMREYDGHSRFLVPLMLPAVLATMALIDSSRRRWFPNLAPLASTAVCSVLFSLPVILTTHYDLATLPCTFPTDISPYVQQNGHDHGYFPTELMASIMKSLPDGEKMAYTMPYYVTGEWRGSYIDPQQAATPHDYAEAMRGKGLRYLISMSSSEPACHNKIWLTSMQRNHVVAKDPLLLGTSGEFSLIKTVDFYQYLIYIFEVQGKSP